MQATVEWFRKSMVKRERKVSNRRDRDHSDLLTLESSCAVRYNKDSRNPEGDQQGTEIGGSEARRRNVMFRASSTVWRERFR